MWCGCCVVCGIGYIGMGLQVGDDKGVDVGVFQCLVEYGGGCVGEYIDVVFLYYGFVLVWLQVVMEGGIDVVLCEQGCVGWQYVLDMDYVDVVGIGEFDYLFGLVQCGYVIGNDYVVICKVWYGFGIEVFVLEVDYQQGSFCCVQ